MISNKLTGKVVGGRYVGAGVDDVLLRVVVTVVLVVVSGIGVVVAAEVITGRRVVVVVVVAGVVVFLMHWQSQLAVPVVVAKENCELSPSSN